MLQRERTREDEAAEKEADGVLPRQCPVYDVEALESSEASVEMSVFTHVRPLSTSLGRDMQVRNSW